MPSSDNFVIRGVPSECVDKFWKLAEPYIKRALDHANGEIDHHDLYALIKDKNVQLWMVANKEKVVGALTTEVVVYPRKKMVRVITLAGNRFDDWFDLAHATVSDFAKTNNCEGIECFVRSGFTKKLSTRGYRKMYEVCYTKI